jgi:competence protein ComEC
LANVLILPAVPYAMLAGSLATVCGMVWLPLGELVALLAWPFLHWLLLAAEWLARVPGASTTIGSFHVGWLWGYYALVGLAWVGLCTPKQTKQVTLPSTR